MLCATRYAKKYFCAIIIFILLQTSFRRKWISMSKKQLYTLEYPVRSSPSILFEFLSTPAGLGEWFADRVDENKEHIFTFTWSDSEEKAELVDKQEDKFVRFRWTHAPKDEYFEFSIEKSEVTNQTILIIKDFAEKRDIADQTKLWEYQIKDLFHRIGS